MFKLIKFLKPYRLPVAIVLVLMFIQALTELYLPSLMADIVDTGIVKGDTAYIVRTGAVMLGVAALGTISAVIAGFFSARTAMGFGKILRDRLFAHVESFSLHEFDSLGTASLITRTTNDITQIQTVAMMSLRLFITAPIMALGGIIMAVSEDPELSWVIVAAVPVLSLAVFLVAGRSVPLFKIIQSKLDKLNQVLREELTGIRVIRAFNRIEHERQRFVRANADLTDTSIRVNKIMAALMPLMMLVMNLTTIAIVWFGGLRIDAGRMQIGSLMAFLQYAMQIMFSMIMVSMMFVLLPRAAASSARINQVLDTAPEIHDPPRAKGTGAKRGFLEFLDVTFRYPGAEQPAIRHVSFSAGPGETTAIIGGTGSGKSTLIHLIPRFYDVDSGSILVDGVDVRELPQSDLRSRIGLVPQKAILFTGTIADNIRYGKADASDAEVRHAAEVAQASEFISAMRDGFDSLIAQGGTNVSGGQKQRLAIARALVRRPEIFLFDDSFSALDFKTDANLRAALKREIGGATLIIVAQRVSTVMDADRIIVLDEGRVAGTGTHSELLKTCAVYREIVASQLSEEEIA
ncbi:ATP-binding cassette subfamily B protein [Hydrogenispora ethanolica]|uniref:ATP-binding cassette subfamily B protein n=1 Tax=Hydrogenispora ethanolica TaxID=1082276 RepID=A0A4R1RHD3_HYDET|nr:ABC transporter ATP-binding protein [Hydrogenispora ethanolica]TCL65346.1 ATP-binding cassette subfamily B protein [Hydrogenispora ethanolica]